MTLLEKKKKFISLVLRRSGIKMYDETKENIKAKIDIKDIRFALNEVTKPKLEIIDAISDIYR